MAAIRSYQHPDAHFQAPTREAWADEALCTQLDPELMFYELQGGKQLTRQAQSICARCPVTAACLEFAIAHDERWGVWGGLTRRGRERLVLARRTAAADLGGVA